MRCITYAGEHLVTSEEIADLLIELTAVLAANGRAEAVTIPIYPEGETYPGRQDTLEIVHMVVGPGTVVLSVPYAWDGPDPDFTDAVTDLRSKLSLHAPPRAVVSQPGGTPWIDDEIYLDPDPTNF